MAHDDKTVSYGELWSSVLTLADSYRRLGVRPGDRVVCNLRTSPEHIVAVCAAWACGAVSVGVHNELTGPELRSVVERTGATLLVFQPRSTSQPLAVLDELTSACPALTAIVHDQLAGGRPVLSELMAGGSDQALAGPPPVTPTPPGDDEPAVVFLTSGTTGRPKAVVDTLPALLAKVEFFAESVGPRPDDVHLMYLPICHAFGLKLSLMALLSGGRLVLLDRFSPEAALRLVTTEQVTVLPGTPTHFTLLLSCLDRSTHDVGSLRWAVSAAATLPAPLAEQIHRRLGAELFVVYGCSEGFLVTTTDRDDVLRGSVGRRVFRAPPGAPPAGTVAIAEIGGAARLPPGQMGEIVFGADCPVRYWDEPDVGGDGWYRTGDVGRLDPDDGLFVLGRLKELVNRGGLKVSAGEVEAALVRHPGVADGAVLATPDDILGEAICACVVPNGPSPPGLHELRTFLGTTLARHKLPDELCLIDHLPRSTIGKLDRGALRALVVDADAPRERFRAR